MHERGGSALNRYLNRTARAAVADVDLVLLLVEALRFTRGGTELASCGRCRGWSRRKGRR
jgi:GTPase Era involved in 16S rRNA processing